MRPKAPKILQELLSNSRVLGQPSYSKIPKDSKRFQKIPKDSKRVLKILKESKRFQKNPKGSKDYKRGQRTHWQRIFSLKESAIAQKANVSSTYLMRIKELEMPAMLGHLKMAIRYNFYLQLTVCCKTCDSKHTMYTSKHFMGTSTNHFKYDLCWRC